MPSRRRPRGPELGSKKAPKTEQSRIYEGLQDFLEGCKALEAPNSWKSLGSLSADFQGLRAQLYSPQRVCPRNAGACHSNGNEGEFRTNSAREFLVNFTWKFLHQKKATVSRHNEPKKNTRYSQYFHKEFTEKFTEQFAEKFTETLWGLLANCSSGPDSLSSCQFGPSDSRAVVSGRWVFHVCVQV